MQLTISQNQLCNEGHPIHLLMIEQFGFNHILNDDIFEVLEAFRATGINGFRVFGFWPYYGQGKEAEPYLKNKDGEYDLEQFNEKFFEFQAKWISAANQAGIIVLYELFDRCGLTTRESVSQHHPYNQLVERSEAKFSDLKNKALWKIQTAYIQKIIDSIGQYPNVILGIMNEFKANADWHRAISHFVKERSRCLLSGSEENSPACNDPNVDIWWVHTGTYDFKQAESHIAKDIAALRKQCSDIPVLGYSTDGFGKAHRHIGTPENMRKLAKDAKSAGVELLAFLDQNAYTEGQGKVHQLSVECYRVMAEEFHPTQLVAEKLPDDMLYRWSVLSLPTTCSDAYYSDGARCVRSDDMSYVNFGPYISNLPLEPLQARFLLKVTKNTGPDNIIVILDVYDAWQDRVLTNRIVTRKDFPKGNEFCAFDLLFTPAKKHVIETRIFYFGGATVWAKYIEILKTA